MMQSSLTLLLGTMVLFPGVAMDDESSLDPHIDSFGAGNPISTWEQVTIATTPPPPLEEATIINENAAAAVVALDDVVTLISQVAAAAEEVTMEDEEDEEEVMFEIGYQKYPIARSILEQGQPNSMLTHLMTEQWKERPSTSVELTGIDNDYFPFVLEYLRNDSVQLPSSKSKDYFIFQMISLKISFDPAKVESLYRPSVMAQAVLATKEQLKCFKELVIDKGLTKKVEDATNELDAAKFAHIIVTKYTTEHSLRVEFDSTVGNDLCRRFRDNADFRAYCNSFLEKFGLEAEAVVNGYRYHGELRLKLLEDS
jgi:hypothetical protein